MALVLIILFQNCGTRPADSQAGSLSIQSSDASQIVHAFKDPSQPQLCDICTEASDNSSQLKIRFRIPATTSELVITSIQAQISGAQIESPLVYTFANRGTTELNLIAPRGENQKVEVWLEGSEAQANGTFGYYGSLTTTIKETNEVREIELSRLDE